MRSNAYQLNRRIKITLNLQGSKVEKSYPLPNILFVIILRLIELIVSTKSISPEIKIACEFSLAHIEICENDLLHKF